MNLTRLTRIGFTPARAIIALVMVSLAACAAPSARPSDATPGTGPTPWPSNLRGHLLLIGGGLDDDNRPVYERFVALARGAATSRAAGMPHAASSAASPLVVIATAASGDQEANAQGKIEAIRAYCPECRFGVIRRESTREETLELVRHADALFFTGGDQKRITDRYLVPDPAAPGPDPARRVDSPEASAMRALLARGGVIAGTSAGDAMMSDPMFLTGRSAEALGIRSTRRETGPDDDADDQRARLPLGPQIGQGMGFLPRIVSDSHFFERHRFGRLVAALETSGVRLGLGVGEDAAAEVDLATGDLVGISVADSLLVDVAGLERANLDRRGVRTIVLTQGTRIALPALLASPPPSKPSTPPPASTARAIPLVEPGQNRQLASWRFFRASAEPAAWVILTLDGYAQQGRPDPSRPGWSIVDLEVPPRAAP